MTDPIGANLEERMKLIRQSLRAAYDEVNEVLDMIKHDGSEGDTNGNPKKR